MSRTFREDVRKGSGCPTPSAILEGFVEKGCLAKDVRAGQRSIQLIGSEAGFDEFRAKETGFLGSITKIQRLPVEFTSVVTRI